MSFILSISHSVCNAHYLTDPYFIGQIGKGITVDSACEKWKNFVQVANTQATLKMGSFINPIYVDNLLVSLEVEVMHDCSAQRTDVNAPDDSERTAFPVLNSILENNAFSILGKVHAPYSENSDCFIGGGFGGSKLWDTLWGTPGYGFFMIEGGYNHHLYNGIYFSTAIRSTHYIGKHAPHRQLNSPSDLHGYIGLKFNWF